MLTNHKLTQVLSSDLFLFILTRIFLFIRPPNVANFKIFRELDRGENGIKDSLV